MQARMKSMDVECCICYEKVRPGAMLLLLLLLLLPLLAARLLCP